jgi:hypothetical protein
MTRRESVPGGRQYRRVVRVSPEEDARLLSLVGGDPSKIAGLLIDSALYRTTATRDEVREVKTELFAVRHQLAVQAEEAGPLAREELRAVAERIDEVLDRLAIR